MPQVQTYGTPVGEAQALCVFLHGRGQSTADMVDMVCGRLDAPGVHFILPKSPRPAWYDAKAVDPLTGEATAQLEEGLQIVRGLMDEAREAADGRPLLIGGFSQGACMTTEYLMRGGKADAAIALTGCRVGAVQDDLPQANLSGLPIYATDSDDDPWIPLWAFQKSVHDFAKGGARLRMDIVPGREHGVADCEIAALSEMLRDVMSGTAPFGGTT
ncbi:alpha/beta hydrolase [Pseudoroseicyclus tamaricis]|uniref:Phospholipase n=1 Tax=Pseudoroseicyclus tamaricis TaxID=2705421 RepID=A0A6B2JWA9_9RHOB|nr:phospholipase [Pseudoroseicyclus tamaricis]NDV02400.1 phospholipase [Pseudoroseicyclus tamaricis]